MTEKWRKDDPGHTGESFWSHKLADGSWCNGKPPKPSTNAVQSQSLDLILNKIIKIETRLDNLADLLKRSNLVFTEKVVPSNKEVPF